VCLFALAFLSCGGKTVVATTAIEHVVLTGQQAQILSTQKVFFGHQSVGDNIIQRVREITAADPRLNLKIVESRNPETVPGPAFVEAHIGHNTDPQSKNADFLTIVNQGFVGIAMFKYCYVDIGESTEVPQMFNAYQATINEVRRNHPGVRIVHMSVPLTTFDSSAKKWLKGILGRNTAQNENIKRNHFNALLRQTYGKDPIFDLAEVESTRSDGSRSYFKNGNEVIYTLAAEYTTDGGHLNQSGRQRAAGRLLQVLAKLQ
jgi:hypothetical protein